MAKPPYLELGQGRDAERIPILYEDRSIIAVDKPRGWMLVPFTWQRTRWNLQAAIQSSIGAGAFWARSRNLRFLRYIHRLDAETSGILLFGRSPGAVRSYGDLFESRQMAKRYLAIVRGRPRRDAWTCELALDKHPADVALMRVVQQGGKAAVTEFRVLDSREDLTLIEARPLTGRTHQIRVHLMSSGHSIVGDHAYGGGVGPMGLRSVELGFTDPFTRRTVRIVAPEQAFLEEYGFGRPAPPAISRPAPEPREVRGNLPHARDPKNPQAQGRRAQPRPDRGASGQGRPQGRRKSA